MVDVPFVATPGRPGWNQNVTSTSQTPAIAVSQACADAGAPAADAAETTIRVAINDTRMRHNIDESAVTYKRRRPAPNDSVRAEFDDIVASVTPGHARTLNAILEWAIAETRADCGDIQLVHPRDGSLRIVAQRGFPASFLQFFRIVKNDMSSCAATMKQGKQIVVPDVATSPLFNESARRAMLEAEALACQSTPILSSGRWVLGVLSTHYHRLKRPTERQLRRVAEMAGYVGELLEHHSLRVSSSVDVSALVDQIRDGSPKTKTIRG
jgi:hypothetical protein